MIRPVSSTTERRSDGSCSRRKSASAPVIVRACRLGRLEKLWRGCSKPSGGPGSPARITRQFSSRVGTDGIIYSR